MRFPALAVASILLLALSLRIPTVSLGPLMPEIRSDTGHGETFLSLLTTIPLALTLAVAPLTPRIAARFGRDRVLGAALAAVVLGTLVRSVPGDVGVLAGTALLGVAIAVGTVLAPATIAAEPAHRRSLLTSTYSMALSLGPALALAATVPLMHVSGLGWRGSLVLWGLCPVLALAVWILHSRAARGEPAAPGSAKEDEAAREAAGSTPRAVGDARVWLLALYLGITSLTFYTTSTWLPTTLVLDGMTPASAGANVSAINVVAVPFAMLAPIAMRRGHSRLVAPLAPVIAVAGVGVLLAAGSSGAFAVVLLLGASQGLCLGVSYAQIVQFATSPHHAGAVSAVTSAVGIALAALGPLAFGFGLENTGTWAPSVAGLGAVLVAQVLIGLRTGSVVSSRR